MVGGNNDKPVEEPKIPLAVGTHVVKIKNSQTGYSQNGNQWWKITLAGPTPQGTEGPEFDHWIGCSETEHKAWDKVWKRAVEQTEALFVYDKVGEQPNYQKWFEVAADMVHGLIGKKIEFEVKEWNINNNSGVWGNITGYVDTPNAAVQVVPNGAPTTAGQNMSEPRPASPEPSFDTTEEIPF